ncbi:IS200/IS605 family element RNA-guided endonuclease TnpB [Paenibacillus sp. YN15]|uniref:IS200/IS605 family element RNA-guided endonuclease TnpB n=1 Tax=Paenibacillus sp. YN15 TaxID=1742774 RepID=UPI000DCBF03F|nr:IS200/IS605 family element RNA-guided endonuclease TnpB [Paenibacillus sp. YN15]RAU97330.1 transposase [Paenibacillus sp. YN15]
MIVHQAYKYRIYPNADQQQLIRRMFGCCRFVFNHFLAKWNSTYSETGKGLSYHSCATALPALKTEYEWLKEVDSIALQSSVRHVADSFGRFFGKQTDAPRFKSRKHPVQSYTTRSTNGNIAMEGSKLKLPKLGWMRFAHSRKLEGRILSATVRQQASGKFFVSLVAEVEKLPLPTIELHIGMDLGLTEYAVCSNGERIANPRVYRKHEEKLARANRRMARRTPGGANHKKAKRQVARIHEHIANTRHDFLHKLTTKLIRENQTISIEHLSVVNMIRNPKLSKSIADASWGEFVRQLTYKASWYGRTLRVADRFEPTSHHCHVCGTVHPEVKNLSIREWTCSTCGTAHDRDENAAHNIKSAAI